MKKVVLFFLSLFLLLPAQAVGQTVVTSFYPIWLFTLNLTEGLPDVEVRNMLGEMADALSLSYLAKRYFEKDKTWLYHRLNNSNVNGKPASFSQQELIILADSLKDLSSKLSDISSNIANSLR